MKGGLGRALKGHGFELVKDRLGYSAPNTVNNVISESQVLLGYFLSLCNHFLIHLVLNIYILMALKCVSRYVAAHGLCCTQAICTQKRVRSLLK